jgi:hypothetical protein
MDAPSALFEAITRRQLRSVGVPQRAVKTPASPAMEVPVIETKRLRLRGHRLGDFTDCAAMWADPIVTRYIGQPFSEEEVFTGKCAAAAVAGLAEPAQN